MNLPEIFKNKINIDKKENIYRGSFNNNDDDLLDNLPVNVTITTNKNIFNTTIVNKTTNYLITIDKRVIYIGDIKDIKRR